MLICALLMGGVIYGFYALPDEISSFAEEKIDIGLFYSCDVDKTEKMASKSLVTEGSYSVNVKLFNSIPVKKSNLTVKGRPYVVPSGEIVGLRLFSKGVMIVGSDKVATEMGEVNPMKAAGLCEGDVITTVDGIEITSSIQTEKIIRESGGKPSLIAPQLVTANDPVTAVYGAFGKFTDENNLKIEDISKVMMTGVGASFVKRNLYGLDCRRVEEFDSIGKGGLYLSGLSEALIVSMGTGTAVVHAKDDGTTDYLGGTGVGGGTLMGLSKLLTNAESIEHIAEYAEGGDLGNIDLRIKDITAKESLSSLSRDLTMANFGNVSDLASKNDLAR